LRRCPSTALAPADRAAINNQRWLRDQRQASAFELLSINRVPIWRREVHPILVVRGASKRTDAFVFIPFLAASIALVRRHRA